MSGLHSCIWHQGASMVAEAVNCSKVNDGIFAWSGQGTNGNNFTIRDSYFHDFTTKTANGHIDGFQTEGASNGVINHNTYLMTADNGNDASSAIAIWNGMRSTNNVAVSNNLIAGGGFAIYAEDYNPSEANPAGGYTLTNVSFTNNRFSTFLSQCVGGYGVWFKVGPSDGWRRSGNVVIETGQNIDNTNPNRNGTGSLCT